MAAEISQRSQGNRVLLTAGYRAAQATLVSMTDEPTTYGAHATVGSP